MKRAGLDWQNRYTLSKVAAFRSAQTPDTVGKITRPFHDMTFEFPIYDYIAVHVDELEFVMFCGNDDLVALTYFWYGPNSYERKSVALWQEMAINSDHFYDVGAFTGLYSFVALYANKAITGVAYEPSRSTFSRLNLNRNSNHAQYRLKTRNAAVADKAGTANFNQFTSSHRLGNGASLLPKTRPIVDSSETVQVVTLDEELEGASVLPDHLKIDVEGAELKVLSGMKNLLEQRKPSILLEVTPDTYEDAVRQLEHHGYRVRLVDELKFEAAACPQRLEKVANLLAEPC